MGWRVEALYLEFLGRVPENKGMLHYVQQIEAADLTLMQVKQAIANSQEATEWAAMKQMERVVIPKDQGAG
ncbi:hypothetical protein T484DRAFT_1808973 [Baffinella frigidus]|nr:hypothetical protein T484DRAFT_1808973 [Cryptophyta sp. CCMP2293]